MDQSKLLRSLAGLAIAAVGVVVTACGGAAGSETASSFPHTQAKAQVRVGGAPVAVATGAGSVWVADNAGSRVLELDPSDGHPVGKPIAVDPGPEAIAVGEGYVWVASGNGAVTRIDPKTHETRRAPARIADPGGIAAGEGAVWVTSRAKGSVTRLDPRSLKVVGSATRVGAEPADVAVGAGAGWVASTADGTVTRIDASTGEAGAPIQVADFQALGLCFGEGGVWVAKTDDRLAQRIEIVRIDPDDSSVGDATAQVRAAIPVRLAAGEGGVWATLVGGVRPPAIKERPGQVALLDPADVSQPSRLIGAGERPAGIAVGAGAVWVADSGDGTVTRIAVGR